MRQPLTRTLFIAALLLLPVAAGAIGFEEARHLLVRTGFEATPAAVARFKPMSYEQAVAKLLKECRTEAVTPPPAWTQEVGPSRPTAQNERVEEARQLKGWWFRELRATPSPLTERMTLFWHGHFASELRKVKSPSLMFRQNQLLRRHALGNFRALLHEIARDPAMLIYLDAAANRKGHIDDSFARALLQEFTLGKGAFRERDVSEAARAFTGWHVTAEGGAERVEKGYDDGVKVVLGRKGRLDGAQVIDTLLRDPRTSERLVRKLWREFISDKPDGNEVKRLAAEFRNNYEIKPLLRNLLLTRAFRSSTQRGRMIKSPVELLAGTVRQFEIAVGDGEALAQMSRVLGQDLFDPPSVKGWSGGTAWVTPDAYTARELAMGRLLRGREEGDENVELAAGLDELSVRQLAHYTLAVPPVEPIPAGLSTHDQIAHLVRDPAYQLK